MTRVRAACAAAVLLLLGAIGAAAAPNEDVVREANRILEERAAEPPAAPADEEGVSVGWLSAKIALVLACLSAGIYGLYRLAVRARLPLMREAGVVRRLALEPIAPDRYLQIVEIGGKVMVLGVTPSSITHVATLEGEAAESVRLAASAAAAGSGVRFSERLRAALPGWSGGEAPAPRAVADRLRSEKKRLQSLGL